MRQLGREQCRLAVPSITVSTEMISILKERKLKVSYYLNLTHYWILYICPDNTMIFEHLCWRFRSNFYSKSERICCRLEEMFNSCRSLHFVGVKLKIIYQAETVPGIVYLNEDCKKLLLSVRLLKLKMLDPDRSKKVKAFKKALSCLNLSRFLLAYHPMQKLWRQIRETLLKLF